MIPRIDGRGKTILDSKQLESSFPVDAERTEVVFHYKWGIE